MEIKRKEFLENATLDAQIKNILKPLANRKETQFKNLYKLNKRKIARQTFVTYLGKAIEANVILRRVEGRATYYMLNFSMPEEKVLNEWITLAGKKLTYLPDDITL